MEPTIRYNLSYSGAIPQERRPAIHDVGNKIYKDSEVLESRCAAVDSVLATAPHDLASGSAPQFTFDPHLNTCTTLDMQVDSHAVKAAFDDLVEQAGGSWPPQSVFEDNWPRDAQLYANLCDRATKRFAYPTPKPSATGVPLSSSSSPSSSGVDMNKCPFAELAKKSRLDGATLAGSSSSAEDKVRNFRQWIKEECRLQLPPSDAIMNTVRGLDQQQRNGFICCLGFLLHMYRWGTCPVVVSEILLHLSRSMIALILLTFFRCFFYRSLRS